MNANTTNLVASVISGDLGGSLAGVFVAARIAERAEAARRRYQARASLLCEFGYGTLRRAVGHLAAPLTADSVVDLVKARFTAIDLLQRDAITDDDFRDARHAHLVTYTEYAMQQHLLTAIGLQTTYPHPDKASLGRRSASAGATAQRGGGR
jgi:hypothetical protein